MRFLLLAITLFSSVAQAAEYGTVPVRRLVAASPDVLIVEPLEPVGEFGDRLEGGPANWRVTRVLAGGLRDGDSVRIDFGGVHFGPRRIEQGHAARSEPFFDPPIQPVACLVFLDPARPNDDVRRIPMSGLRCLDDLGRVLEIRQLENPGPLYLHSDYLAPSWTGLLCDVEERVREVRAVRLLLDAPPDAARREAILAWLRRHSSELHGNSWGGLPPLLASAWAAGASADERAQLATELGEQGRPWWPLVGARN